MFGEKRKLTTRQRCLCKKHVALRVDPEDVKQHKRGVLVQDDREWRPYPTPQQR